MADAAGQYTPPGRFFSQAALLLAAGLALGSIAYVRARDSASP